MELFYYLKENFSALSTRRYFFRKMVYKFVRKVAQV